MSDVMIVTSSRQPSGAHPSSFFNLAYLLYMSACITRLFQRVGVSNHAPTTRCPDHPLESHIHMLIVHSGHASTLPSHASFSLKIVSTISYIARFSSSMCSTQPGAILVASTN